MKKSEEMLEFLGDDAKQAYRNNGTWEYQPETIEVGNWNPYWCGDCDTWHQNWYMFGYRIEDGNLFEVIHSCDTDGNWETEDELNVDDVDYEKWRECYDYSETRKYEKAYAEWVVENGEDPLGNYFLSFDTPKKFQVKVELREDGFHFQSAFFDNELVTDPQKIPKRLHSYLCLEEGTKLDLNDIKDVPDLIEVLDYVKSHDEFHCEFEVILDVPRDQSDITKDLIDAAQRHLSSSFGE